MVNKGAMATMTQYIDVSIAREVVKEFNVLVSQR
jgi:hypothetical protein